MRLPDEVGGFVVGLVVGEAYDFDEVERVHSELPVYFCYKHLLISARLVQICSMASSNSLTVSIFISLRALDFIEIT